MFSGGIPAELSPCATPAHSQASATRLHPQQLYPALRGTSTSRRLSLSGKA